jgi:hypothetical protein
MSILNILWTFGIFYEHLVHFVVIWYIFPVLVSCTKKNLAALRDAVIYGKPRPCQTFQFEWSNYRIRIIRVARFFLVQTYQNGNPDGNPDEDRHRCWSSTFMSNHVKRKILSNFVKKFVFGEASNELVIRLIQTGGRCYDRNFRRKNRRFLKPLLQLFLST